MKRDHAGLHSAQCSELNWGSVNKSCIKCSLQAVANPSSLVKLNNLIFLVPSDGSHFNLGYCFCFFFFPIMRKISEILTVPEKKCNCEFLLSFMRFLHM